MTRLEESLDIIRELLNCCELNLDEMEPETIKSIERAEKFLEKCNKEK